MLTEEFIKKQVESIHSGFELSQIQDNVYRFIFSKYIPDATLNTCIKICMELYAEILKRSK